MTTPSITQLISLPERLFIARSALDLMIDETIRRETNGQFENETGGILIGRRLDRRGGSELLIAAATGPGDDAVQRPVEFNPDVDYVNEQLRPLFASFPRLDYIGTWHKHPPHYPHFSPGDVLAAHTAFSDSSYKMDELVAPILWIVSGELVIRYYYMSRAMADAKLPFEEIPEEAVYLVDDGDPLIDRERIGALSSYLQAELEEDYRLLVQRGYNVRLSKQQHEYYVAVTKPQLRDTTIHLVVPPGFPKLPPSVLAERRGKALATNDDGMIGRWTFNRDKRPHLVDVVEAVQRNLSARPVSPATTFLLAAVISALVLLTLVTSYSLYSANQREALYKARWAAIDQAFTQASIPELEVALTQLQAIREEDPQGKVFERNQTASNTLVHANLLLVELYVANNQLDQAELKYQAATDLQPSTPEDAERIATAQSIVSVARAATQTAVTDQAQALAQWRATLDSAEALIAAKQFASARKQAEKVNIPASDPEARRRAVDLIARALIAEGEQQLQQKRLEDANKMFAAVAALDPSPTAERTDRAQELLGTLTISRTTLRLRFQEYDRASNAANWEAAVAAIDGIVFIVGPTPDPAQFQPPTYDQRLPKVVDLRANARLRSAMQLQLAGSIDDARNRYFDVQQLDNVASDDIQADVRKRLAILNEAGQLWNTYKEQTEAGAWKNVVRILERLRDLEGFGPDALQPKTSERVAYLLARANERARPTAVPPRPPTSPPQAPPPTAVPLPQEQPTSTLTIQPSPEPTLSPTPAPAPGTTYQVTIETISLEELTATAGGALPAGINTYIAGLSGLTLKISTSAGVTYIVQSDSRFTTLGSGSLTITVTGDGSGQPPQTTGRNTVQPEANTYYRITVGRVG